MILGYAWCRRCDVLFKVPWRTGANTKCPTCDTWTSDCRDRDGHPVNVRGDEELDRV